jgi:LPXTG-motif cell wall-anchored protein
VRSSRPPTADGVGSSPPTAATPPPTFVVVGSSLIDHPRSTLLGETFGATAPWFILLGLCLMGASLLARRKEARAVQAGLVKP